MVPTELIISGEKSTHIPDFLHICKDPAIMQYLPYLFESQLQQIEHSGSSPLKGLTPLLSLFSVLVDWQTFSAATASSIAISNAILDE